MKMVEKAPNYRTGSRSMPGVTLLGNMAPFVNTDVTNPRELYSMLSESRHQGSLLTSVKLRPQAGSKLPPLEISSETQFRTMGKQAQYSSFPDLASFRNEQGTRSEHDTMRRSSSLQDVSNLDHSHNGSKTKKLKPILRANDSKNANEHQEKAGVKFAEKEVHLIRDSPLPPIEVMGDLSLGKDSVSVGSGLGEQHGENVTLTLSHSPRQHRRNGAECPSEIFPRGQPVEVKKPVTPTYDDYPEAYWELRSPTVQDPSDLKEDMIDRNRYRLQQISSLRLRAMNRELMANRLDSYRKWQQQMFENSSPGGLFVKQDSARGSVTPSINGPTASSRTGIGKQQRMTVPLGNGTLAVAATSISPATNPAIKKRSETNKGRGVENAARTNQYITEDELRRRQKIEAAARGVVEVHEAEAKPIKAAVVNLCIDPDRSSSTPTSDVYNGIRRIMFGTRPLSHKTRTQVSLHSQISIHGHVSLPGRDNMNAPESVSATSIHATVGSSQSYCLPRVPSAPANSVIGGDMTNLDNSAAGKKILKKFNKLQVFSEKYSGMNNPLKEEPWDVVNAKRTEKSPYLPQNRPPTYKLDTKNHLTRHQVMGRNGEEMGVIAESGDSYSRLPDERGLIPFNGNYSPTKSETTALSFRFNNGEVIVSRQGKRPSLA